MRFPLLLFLAASVLQTAGCQLFGDRPCEPGRYACPDAAPVSPDLSRAGACTLENPCALPSPQPHRIDSTSAGALANLTAIVWLTQILRFLDFMLSRGLSLLDFLYLTGLMLPSLLLMLLPISLAIAVIYTYNKLTVESELIVLNAVGSIGGSKRAASAVKSTAAGAGTWA